MPSLPGVHTAEKRSLPDVNVVPTFNNEDVYLPKMPSYSESLADNHLISKFIDTSDRYMSGNSNQVLSSDFSKKESRNQFSENTKPVNKLKPGNSIILQPLPAKVKQQTRISKHLQAIKCKRSKDHSPDNSQIISGTLSESDLKTYESVNFAEELVVQIESSVSQPNDTNLCVAINTVCAVDNVFNAITSEQNDTVLSPVKVVNKSDMVTKTDASSLHDDVNTMSHFSAGRHAELCSSEQTTANKIISARQFSVSVSNIKHVPGLKQPIPIDKKTAQVIPT